MDLDVGHMTFPANAYSAGAHFTRWVLHLTVTGAAAFTVAEGEVTTTAPGILLIRPGVDIRWRVTTPPWQVIWFVFAPPAGMLPWLRFPELGSDHLGHRIRVDATAHQVEAHLRRAHGFATDLAHPGRVPLTMNAIEAAMLQCHFDQEDSAPPLDPRVTAALRFLGGRIERPTTVAEVAVACGTSRSRLLAMFRQEMGMPLMEWFEQERLRRAQGLLTSPYLSVRQIAAAVGFSDPRYFARRFRRRFGVKPSAARGATR
jgi:AraC family transcriptional regulator of arabinose operon